MVILQFDLGNQRSRSQVTKIKIDSGSNILLTLILFISCQSALTFLRYGCFKTWPSKYKVKVICQVLDQGHIMGPTFYWFHLSFLVIWPSHSWDTSTLKFDLGNIRSRSQVRSKFKVTSWVHHPIDSHGFYLIGSPIPQIWWFQNLTLKIQGQSSGWHSGLVILLVY